MPKLFHVLIQNDVNDELDRIARLIARDKPTAAQKFIRELSRKILELERFPLRGSRVKILESSRDKAEIRFLEHRGYLIFYTVQKASVLVLHVTSPGQDWISLLR